MVTMQSSRMQTQQLLRADDRRGEEVKRKAVEMLSGVRFNLSI